MNRVILMLIMLVCAGIQGYSQTTVDFQDFESTTGTALPTGWTQHSTGSPGWKTGDSTTLSFGYGTQPIPGHTRFVALLDDTLTNNSHDTLMTPTLDFTSVTHPGVGFDYYFWDLLFGYSGGPLPMGKGEKVSILISKDNGASWTLLDTLIKGGSCPPLA